MIFAATRRRLTDVIHIGLQLFFFGMEWSVKGSTVTCIFGWERISFDFVQHVFIVLFIYLCIATLGWFTSTRLSWILSIRLKDIELSWRREWIGFYLAECCILVCFIALDINKFFYSILAAGLSLSGWMIFFEIEKKIWRLTFFKGW